MYKNISICTQYILKGCLGQFFKKALTFSTIDQEYFGVTKVMWVKCLMSFNFVELASIQIYLTPDILLHEFFCIMCTCSYSDQNGSTQNGIQHTWLPCLAIRMHRLEKIF